MMTDTLPSVNPHGVRPKRTAAKNALYRPCPTCNRKFLLTEIEFHVNLCIEKMEKAAAQLLDGDVEEEDEVSPSSFGVDPRFAKIPKAPIYYPTAKEFENPLAYIESIKPEAQKFGICKIVPPNNTWLKKSFEETVKNDNFFFQTKKQDVRQLARRGVTDTFYCKLQEFLNENGSILSPIPRISGIRVHLYYLYIATSALGGYDKVCENDLWGIIASQLKLPPLPETIEKLRSIYKSSLYLYETATDKFDLPEPSKKIGNFGMSAVSVPSMGMRAMSQNYNSNTANSDTEEDEDNRPNTVYNPDSDDSDDDDSAFGFASGMVYSLRGFKRQATKFAKTWFSAQPGIPVEKQVDLGQIETEFWKIVEEKEEHCRVQYGSDLDVKSHGSGFSLECTNPWNLNILPTLPKSLLRYLPEHVSGITIPMMYVGMMFSCFCWHVEDDYLYSINYLHTGAPKLWYGVSSFNCAQFEKVMKDAYPDLFKVQPGLLHHLTTMISPLELIDKGVPVYSAQQNAGEFMITFPQAYHGGLNTGFNVAEAVNFATPDWIPFGRLCVANYKLVKRTHIFSNIELIVNALQLETDPDIMRWLFDAFWKARNDELVGRGNVLKAGCKKIQQWAIDGPLPHSKPCSVCNAECYLSCITCPCSPEKYACLDHSIELCSCPISKKILLTRYTTELMNAVAQTAERTLSKSSKKRYSPHK